MDKKQPTFEEKLDKLSKIVKALGDGNLSLTDSLDKFEAGMTLSHQLKSELSDANKKVAHIIGHDGKSSDLFE